MYRVFQVSNNALYRGGNVAQPNLEQYVANRYMHDLHQIGYQPICQEMNEMLEDALKVMAALNQATQYVKKNVSQKRASL